jgi:hypothetical protein
VILFEQIALGNKDAVQRLLVGGLPADAKDGSRTADSTLHWAASFGQVEIARLLISNGCEIDVNNAAGDTPLYIAVKGLHVELIRLLLEEGAILDVNKARTLLPADATNPRVEAVEQLLQNPPIPDPQLRSGYLRSKEKRANEDKEQGEINEEKEEQFENQNEAHSLLIFWPPVFKQFRSTSDPPLVLRSDENLLVCICSQEVDIFPVLTWSGFLDSMDLFGFQVQVKRTTQGAKIRLCLDTNVCPQRQSYRLICTSKQLQVIAADYAGLLYGMHTVLQLFQLHSDTRRQQNVTQISVPAVQVLDYPQTPQRAALWSFRSQSCQTQLLREQIDLLSRLRLNALLLLLDPVQENEEGEEGAKDCNIANVEVRCINFSPTVSSKHHTMF